MFTDKQRETIGTMYKEEGKREATKQGVKYVSENLYNIYEQIENLRKEYKLLVGFCARGGMRSSSVVSLFTTFGMNIVKLENGYKGYRAYINDNLEKQFENIKLVTLYGKTGCGKTEILKELKSLGVDVLDIEGCANHRGSILGTMGIGKEHSQKQFESNVFEVMKNLKSNVVYTEGESSRLGKIVLPSVLYKGLQNSEKILVDADLDFRCNVIKKDYIKENFNKEEVYKLFDKLGRYIKEEKVNYYKNLVETENYETVIKELMENYYDKNYKCTERTFNKTIINSNSKQCAKDILEKWKF